MSQYAYPTSDISTGSWTTTPLYGYIDEVTPVDADNITSSKNPTNDTFECKFGSTITDPGVHTSHVLRTRFKDDKNAATLNLYLYQGTTLIASNTGITLTSSYAEYTIALSEVEAGNITDYTDLRVRADVTGTANNYGYCSWARFETPDATTFVTLAGNLSGSGAIVSTMDRNRGILGSLSGSGSLAVDMDRIRGIEGNIAGSGSMSADLVRITELSAALAGLATVIGDLTITGSGAVVDLAGIIAGLGSIAPDLTRVRYLGGDTFVDALTPDNTGDFEDWNSTTDLTYWSEYLEGGTSSINQEATVVKRGQYSVKMYVDASGNYCMIQQPETYVPYKSYFMSIWHNTPIGNELEFRLRSSGIGNPCFYFDGQVWTTATAPNDYCVKRFAGTGDWKKETLFFYGNPAGDSTNIQIWAGFRSALTDFTLYFDDLRIGPVSGGFMGGDFDRIRGLSGSSSGSSTIAAALRRILGLLGSSEGSGSITGDLSLTRGLAGAISGLATVIGDLSISGTQLLAGILSGYSTVTTRLSANLGLSGDLSGSGAVAGDLSLGAYVLLEGIISGSATVLGDMSATKSLAGEISGIASIQADVNRILYLAGGSTGQAAVSAAMEAIRYLQAVTGGSSTVSGNLSTEGLILLAGAIQGSASVQGDVRRIRGFAGSINAVGSAIADLTKSGTIPLSGSISASSVVEGAISILYSLTGQSLATGTLTGSPTNLRYLEGSTSGSGSATGLLNRIRYLAGDLVGAASVTADLFVILGFILLSGTISGSSTVSGSASMIRGLSGTIQGLGTMIGDIFYPMIPILFNVKPRKRFWDVDPKERIQDSKPRKRFFDFINRSPRK